MSILADNSSNVGGLHTHLIGLGRRATNCRCSSVNDGSVSHGIVKDSSVNETYLLSIYLSLSLHCCHLRGRRQLLFAIWVFLKPSLFRLLHQILCSLLFTKEGLVLYITISQYSLVDFFHCMQSDCLGMILDI